LAMSRIKLQLPESFNFFTLIPIRITDINYGGHVGNDTILTLLHEARMHFFKNFGYSEMELEGVSLIMSDAAIEFRSESFYGDTIKAFVKAHNFSRVGFDLYYKLLKTKDESIVAVAKTAMICYDYQSKRILSLPEKLKRTLDF
jgi:acyl-CoA thioester hydrolase